MPLDEAFWTNCYDTDDMGWDIGYPSPPLREYIDQLEDVPQILIPGCGNCYEGQYLYEQGFNRVFILDLSPEPLKRFSERVPEFPEDQLIHADFFDHGGRYDLVLEQTFFCALPRERRADYAKHVHDLLKPGGKLAGVLFDDTFADKDPEEPPFGGTKEEYLGYFEPLFKVKAFESAYNSIEPRAGREFFMILEKE